MVHPAFLSPDILSIVCQSLPQGSLSALARTAKKFQDPALRELWRSITEFSHLLFPFGSSVDRTGENLCFSHVPTPAQWDRFQFYAQHVRDLEISYHKVELSSLSILLQRHPLLPRLKSLKVSMKEPNPAISTISMFFVSSIEKFAFLSNPKDILALEPLVVTLGTTSPALQELTILLSPGEWEFGTSIFVFHNLRVIDIPLTSSRVHSVLPHLSTLPSLSRIRFYFTELAEIPSANSRYTFSAATDLTLCSRFDDHSIRLLDMTRFDNLNILRIYFDEFRTGDDSLSKAISISCGQLLHRVVISAEVEEDVEHIKFSTLHPLFKFTNLRSFTFGIKHTFYPTNEDIQGITRSWPNLEELCGDAEYDLSNDPARSPLTLAGLLLLIEQCTRLMKISIAVDTRQIPKDASAISRPGLTIDLDPWSSEVNCPPSVADFLSLSLPDANITTIEGVNPELEEALSLRQYFLKGQQAGEERMTQKLQMDMDDLRLENACLRALLN